MSEAPLVSVIVASYNHEPYIEQSIQSVLDQSYSNVELLVVDDGSRDNSVKRIQKLQAKYGFDFRVQENQGLARTLNAAIARCQGSLIVPFGSDDVMLPQRIETQVRYMEGRPEVGICAANIRSIGPDGESLSARDRDRLFRRLDFEDMFESKKSGPPAPTLMFRREALAAVGGFDPTIKLEDLQVELKILRAGWYIDVLGEVLALYRVHPTNTYKNRRMMIESVLETYALFADHPAYPRVCARFLNSMLLKCAGQDRGLMRDILRQLPLRYWDRKTFRAFLRALVA